MFNTTNNVKTLNKSFRDSVRLLHAHAHAHGQEYHCTAGQEHRCTKKLLKGPKVLALDTPDRAQAFLRYEQQVIFEPLRQKAEDVASL